MSQAGQHRETSRRAVAAFIASPPAAAAVVGTAVLPFAMLSGDADEQLIAVVGGLFGGTLILGYLVGCLAGIPLYRLFCRLGWTRRRHSFLLGATIGIGSGILFGLVGLLDSTTVRSQTAEFITGVVVIALLSAVTMGLLFAWVIRPRRSDLDMIAATFD